tara:strand:+ start:362 stop:1366 length:1005 start_codon:yes stop_codon:yes gene_type:complete
MTNKVTIAVDAMGGENSPKKILTGIEISLKKNKDNFFLLYGQESVLNNELKSFPNIKDNCKIINATDVILDEESPLTAAKRGKDSSMWKSIQAQKDGQADITLSAGNTGALLVISRLILKSLENIDKPALAGLWPSQTATNVVLDLGANIECNEKNLIEFSEMGSALFKSLFPNDKPKVALLNVGLEEIKGNEILKKAFNFLKNNKNSEFDFEGFIEGNHIMDGDVNVIVTDGFTGNVALKTAEGTANFFTKNLKNSLNKISLFFSYLKLKKFKDRIDPRKYNGAILLGLQGPVVKSHGSIDSLGFAYSIEMCNKIVKANLIRKIKSHLINIDE